MGAVGAKLDTVVRLEEKKAEVETDSKAAENSTIASSKGDPEIGKKVQQIGVKTLIDSENAYYVLARPHDLWMYYEVCMWSRVYTMIHLTQHTI